MASRCRPQDGAVSEELEKTVFQNFTAAANSISQLYAAAEEQRRVTFHAGEQHGLDKVRQWIISRQGEGLPVTEAEIIAYLQNELGCIPGEEAMSSTSQSVQTSGMDVQRLTTSTPHQILQIPEGDNEAKIFTFASDPTSPTRGNRSPDVAQGGFLGAGNLQAPQVGNTEMQAGNCLPPVLTQLDHDSQGENLPESPESAMDMNID